MLTRHSLISILPSFLLLTAVPAFSSENSVQKEIQNDAAIEREAVAAEDPLAQRQSEKIENPVLHSIMPDNFNLYGSLRVRYRETRAEALLGDGGSRTGIDAQIQFHEDYWLLGRCEIGFNLLDQLDLLFDPGGNSENEFGDSVFWRLAYAGLETPMAFFTFGKNWSTYYQIASFTDRFQGAGGGASGAFNAGTDGGASGTGRADRALQTRIQIDHPWGPLSIYKPFALNVQFQSNEKIAYTGGMQYEYGLGLSAILERKDNMKFGVAFNYSSVDNVDLPRLRPIGISGDDVAVLIGYQWFGPDWYAATTFSWLDNHMATEDGIYFDAWGSEGYGHYQLMDKIWLVGGWNYLAPRSGEQQAGSYILRYTVLGLRYTFKDFEQMIYANIRFDNSILESTGSREIGNVYTVGIKWNFSYGI